MRNWHLNRGGFPLSFTQVVAKYESQKTGNSLWPAFLLPTFSNANYSGWDQSYILDHFHNIHFFFFGQGSMGFRQTENKIIQFKDREKLDCKLAKNVFIFTS